MASTPTRTVVFLEHPLAGIAAGKLVAAAKSIGLTVVAPTRPAGDIAPEEVAAARFVVGFCIGRNAI